VSVIAESFEARYERVVAATLEALADPTDKITYGISSGLGSIQCEPGPDEDPLAYLRDVDEDEEGDCSCSHEVSVLAITWTIERARGFYYANTVYVPLEDGPVANADVQHCLSQGWQHMMLRQAEVTMIDLDEKMDAIVAEHERS
jgi:hypothetical protein